MRAVAFTGRSGAGRGELIEAVIAELTRRGRRVAYLKRAAHDFELDQEGKDTWKAARAGARSVVIASATKLARIDRVDSEPALSDVLAGLAADIEYALLDGYRDSGLPTIEVRRDRDEPLTTPAERLLAVVGPFQGDEGAVRRTASALSDTIESTPR